ncbi:16S rRNA (cytidine(1402)-2'-O)-methyltransferase [Candidatus Roizmanbacteria bacterium]|nr:16S rRNA (cytidine(1402)-2'-O)-methyltransferase [Candidatus Roizmanbacteria bacterium]
MLYVVCTPIGNLDDLSRRQARTLADAEIILTEDTRSTGYLLERIVSDFSLTINPAQRLISYYKEKEFEKLPHVLELLNEDKMIALISEAGNPAVSDPGYLLIKHVIHNQLPFTVIPGPSAVTTALLHSGFDPCQFQFIGFLPRKKSHIISLLRNISEMKKIAPKLVTICFESPQRLPETLRIMNEIVPDMPICICRELTKKFEEVLRGKPQNFLDATFKGEITLVLS